MKNIVLAIAVLFSVHTIQAQVIVTSGGNVDMCVGGAYKTIPDFKVAEKVNTDFNASTSLQTYELSAPNNFEFNPGVGGVATPASTDISFAYLNVTANKITLNYFLNATAKKDSFIFQNIQVRAVGTNSSNDLRFTGGTASQNQNNTNQYVHAHLNSTQLNVTLNLGSLSNLCINAGDKTLNGGNPGGGTYSGTGVTGNTFSPTAATVGTYTITYTVFQSGCTMSATGTIKVNPKPSVTFFGLDNTYCSNGPDDELTGFPAGGTFSGSQAISGNVFRPYAPSVGNKNITYSYTDANGCSDSYTLPTTILQAPSVTISLNPNKTNFSQSENPVTIDGTQSDPNTGGTITVTGNGVSTVSGVSKFYPNLVGAGSMTITRTLVAPNGCSAEAKKTVVVSASNGTVISNLGNQYCINDAAVTVSSNNKPASFSGPGISNVDFINGTATFTPSIAYPSITSAQPYVEIELLYVDGNGVVDKVKQQVFIYALPEVTLYGAPNIQTKYCSSDPQVQMLAFPTGGTFGINGTGGISGSIFTPANASKGINLTITYTYTDVNGCTNTSSVPTRVEQTPTNVSFTGLSSKYCENGAISTLTGFPDTTGVFSGNGVNGNKFDPKIAETYNTSTNIVQTISYKWTDPVTLCSNTSSQDVEINKKPQVSLNGLNSKGEYCFGDGDISLNGFPSGGTIVMTTIGSTIDNGLTFVTTPTNIFKPSKANAGSYNLTYTYVQPITTCSNQDTKTIVVHKLPTVSFTGLNTQYCDKDAPTTLTGNPEATSGLTTGTFSGSIGIAGNSSFIPNLAGVGEHNIKYTFIDENGCINSATKTSIVYGKPVPYFKLSSVCEGDTIHFRDSSSTVDAVSTAMSMINQWNWQIDNTTFNKEYVDTTLKQGNHIIIYNVTTSAGCTSSISKPIYIGPYPIMGFSWDNVCNADNTEFDNSTYMPDGSSGWIDTIRWTFGDGGFKNYKANNNNPSIDYWNVNHTYPTYGIYNVTQTAITNLNCKAIDSQKVYILPSEVVTPSHPYSNDFESDEGGWVSSAIYDDISTWKWGIANKSVINTVSENDHVWVTGLTGANKPDEVSYVYSPCFNLASLTKPMIRMNIWRGMDTISNYSGAVLQYSADGVIWRKVGDKSGEGINWYNNTGNINSKPNGNFEVNQDGWTGMDSLGWDNARHVLDTVISAAGTNNLRFRIAFAASSTPYNGFAFDDVWIGERSKFVLTEHFTSNSSIPAISENSYINGKTNLNIKDMAQLQYHTGFAGPDQLFSRNVSDPGARALYYGISQVPASTLDGSYYNGSTRGVDDRRIRSRVLEDPQFSVDIQPDLFDPASQNISGSVIVESKIPVSNNVTVQIAILERYVNNVQGQNNETSYQWVHAKFLPDAAGKSFGPNWSVGHTETLPFSWDFNASTVYNPDKIAVIAFVQDNVTKEIYQAAYKGVGATVTTGVFDPAEATSTVSLYPNPADDITTVVLNGKLSGKYNWLVIDEIGRIVDEGVLTDGVDGFTIKTQNYTNGFYTLRLSNNNSGVKTQKFVVIH